MTLGELLADAFTDLGPPTGFRPLTAQGMVPNLGIGGLGDAGSVIKQIGDSASDVVKSVGQAQKEGYQGVVDSSGTKLMELLITVFGGAIAIMLAAKLMKRI